MVFMKISVNSKVSNFPFSGLLLNKVVIEEINFWERKRLEKLRVLIVESVNFS